MNVTGMDESGMDESGMDESGMDNPSEFSKQVSNLIRSRRTSKILANADAEISFPHDDEQRLNAIVMQCVNDAGFAPFHYARAVDCVAEPWRFYVLHQATCRHIAEHLGKWFSDMRPNNKLPAMLKACGCLVLITWLPQFDEEAAQKQRQVNEEHLAAAAAATQNFLLSLTAHELKTYWSSGGFFRTAEMFDRLEISQNERLLSAIFVDYGVNASDVEILAGKQHAVRSSAENWTRVIELD